MATKTAEKHILNQKLAAEIDKGFRDLSQVMHTVAEVDDRTDRVDALLRTMALHSHAQAIVATLLTVEGVDEKVIAAAMEAGDKTAHQAMVPALRVIVKKPTA